MVSTDSPLVIFTLEEKSCCWRNWTQGESRKVFFDGQVGAHFPHRRQIEKRYLWRLINISGQQDLLVSE